MFSRYIGKRQHNGVRWISANGDGFPGRTRRDWRIILLAGSHALQGTPQVKPVRSKSNIIVQNESLLLNAIAIQKGAAGGVEIPDTNLATVVNHEQRMLS